MDAEDKAGVTIRYGSQVRDVAVINESGLYCLILSGKLPAAKRFRQWVTVEVLLGIRKRGKRIPPRAEMLPENSSSTLVYINV